MNLKRISGYFGYLFQLYYISNITYYCVLHVNGSHGWQQCGNIECRSYNFIASPFHESGRPRKYEGLWFLSLSYVTFLIANNKMRNKILATSSATISSLVIDGGNGGAMGLQPQLILRVLHRIFLLPWKYFLFSTLAPPDFTIFL